jgi:hypothetical protein
MTSLQKNVLTSVHKVGLGLALFSIAGTAFILFSEIFIPDKRLEPLQAHNLWLMAGLIVAGIILWFACRWVLLVIVALLLVSLGLWDMFTAEKGVALLSGYTPCLFVSLPCFVSAYVEYTRRKALENKQP